jgi:hypothetical protein
MPGEKWEGVDRDDRFDRNGLLAAWRRLTARAEFGRRDWYELDERGAFVPDLCVEVPFDSERERDIAGRVTAYVQGGADEVIVVKQHGQVEFWGAKGQRQASMFGVTLSLERLYCEEGRVSAGRSLCG